MLDFLSSTFILGKIYINDSLNFTTYFAASCQPGQDFIGLPTWYKFLEGEGTQLDCAPVVGGLDDIWLIVLAVVELLIRLAALTAIIFVIIGGIKMMIARANPEKIASARGTLINAVVGVIIAVVAIAAVNFIGSSFN